MSGQYSYPAAQTNPTAYAPAAQQQQQRSGPIIVGATAARSTTSTTATSSRPVANTAGASYKTSTASAASSASKTTAAAATNKAPPVVVGRYANESLAILDAYSSEVGNSGRKRNRSDCMKVLDRLVPPLFLSTSTNHLGSRDDDVGDASVRDKEQSNKRNKGGTGKDSEQQNKAKEGEGGNDQSNNETNSQNASSTSDTSKVGYHKQLQEKLQRYKQQNEQLMERRQNIYKSMVALHELYETGLDGIARMNDLRFVPDNVMPDSISPSK